nr:DUF3324 domain-containing protein [Vagococcus martis]
MDNEYSYVYTISLKENNKELSTRFKDNDSFVKNNYINVSFRNDVAKIVNNIKIESTLKKEGSDKVLDTFSVDKYTMAPNSDIEIPMFDKANLDDGNYITTTTITNGKKNWKFTSKIKLDSKETDDMDSIVESNKEDSNNKFIIMVYIVIVFFLLTSILYFILKKYKFK